MKTVFNTSGIALSLVLVVAGSSVVRSAEKAAGDAGSIKGTISVSGVRSPENVLVYIEKAPGEYPPPKEPAEMDQVKLVFTPSVLPIVNGTTVKFLNGDPILHNVFWPKSKTYATHNLGSWGKGTSKSYTFKKLGEIVLLCNVHAEMEGHIVILQNPFFSLVDKDGSYEIDNVPAGEYTVKTWYSKPKKLRTKSAKVSVSADKAAELDFSLSRRR